MKILIAGSRTINGYKAYELLQNIWFHQIPKEWLACEAIVSGCAAGVDSLAIMLAKDYQYPCIEMPANWKKYGRGAGFIRNAEMAALADAAVILWDGKSNGTSNMIQLMQSANKPVSIHIEATQ